MGQRVEFASNGHECQGYLAIPASGKGPAVVVIQEWWGLVAHIEDVVERFAKEGFIAIAPDLYHGKTTKSPDEAGRILMEMDVERAGQEIAGAGGYLLRRPECSSKKYGIVGFCMGGALAQYVTAKEKNAAGGVSFYGGFGKVSVGWDSLSAPLMLFYGEEDKSVPADKGLELEKTLKAMGKKVELKVYPKAGHAFFNDTRPQVYSAEASADAWRRTIDFFRKNIH